MESLNAADTAWMMTSTALVLLMTLPGIALFYAGMVRKKSVINTMASVVAIAGLLSLLCLPGVRNHTVYGRLPASQSVPAGSYVDQVVLTITY